MDAATGCPTGDRLHTAYEELFTVYFDMVKGLVSRAGIMPLDVEDVAMEIIAKFIEKGGIEQYDPHKVHTIVNQRTPGPRQRTAKFKGMLRAFTVIYVMSWRDKQMMKAKREPLRLEKEMDDGTEWASNIMDEAHPYEDIDTTMGIRAAVEAARFELLIRQQERDALPKRNGQRRDLIACFDLMLHEGYMSGRLTRAQASASLGVSESAVGAMLKEIKEVLRSEMDHLQVAMP